MPIKLLVVLVLLCLNLANNLYNLTGTSWLARLTTCASP
jgi:hypothetical protein